MPRHLATGNVGDTNLDWVPIAMSRKKPFSQVPTAGLEPLTEAAQQYHSTTVSQHNSITAQHSSYPPLQPRAASVRACSTQVQTAQRPEQAAQRGGPGHMRQRLRSQNASTHNIYTVLRSTAQHCAALHSTAQHCAALHSTAQHCTACCPQEQHPMRAACKGHCVQGALTTASAAACSLQQAPHRTAPHRTAQHPTWAQCCDTQSIHQTGYGCVRRQQLAIVQSCAPASKR
jgi:hypothetical protein